MTSDLLVRVRRGPVLEDWMVKRVVFEAVGRSRVDFHKGSADAATAVTAHFM